MIWRQSPHDMPSVKWKTSEPSGVIQSKSKCLTSRVADDVSPRLSPRALEPGVVVSQGGRRWGSRLQQIEKCSFLRVFLLFGPSADWVTPTCIGEDELYVNANLFQKYSLRHTWK